jgi:hypothetical protein
MTDYAKLVKRELERCIDWDLSTMADGAEPRSVPTCGAIREVARAIEELARENEELDFLKWEGGEESVGREIERAYQRGREAGIREAAAIGAAYEPRCDTCPSGVENAILALLDKSSTAEKNAADAVANKNVDPE